jgi:hypothetical protein
LKTHNLKALVLFCGLYDKFKAYKNLCQENDFVTNVMFNDWSENVRYKPSGSVDGQTVKRILSHLKNNTGLLQWIEKI